MDIVIPTMHFDNLQQPLYLEVEKGVNCKDVTVLSTRGGGI